MDSVKKASVKLAFTFGICLFSIVENCVVFSDGLTNGMFGSRLRMRRCCRHSRSRRYGWGGGGGVWGGGGGGGGGGGVPRPALCQGSTRPGLASLSPCPTRGSALCVRGRHGLVPVFSGLSDEILRTLPDSFQVAFRFVDCNVTRK